jgi:acetyl-CoA C-acetyltransferase
MVPVVARSELERCRGAQLARKAALQAFGLTIDNVDLIDLYSCFPVAVEIYAAELGISLDRDPTVTGGMPFAGGPCSNYVLQATCRMVTKQGFGLWSSEPPPTDFHFVDLTDAVALKSKPRRVLENYNGPACVVGYTAVYEPNTAPRAIAIADVEGQGRVVAASEDPEVAARMQSKEFCGQAIGVNGASFNFQDESGRTKQILHAVIAATRRVVSERFIRP